MKNLRKLPPACYALMDGRPVMIMKGAREPIPVKQQPGFVAMSNMRLGVTEAQRHAMEVGVVFGWNHPRCDPDPNQKPELYDVELPVLLKKRVLAYSLEDAVEEAGLELPEGCEVDGSVTAEVLKVITEEPQ